MTSDITTLVLILQFLLSAVLFWTKYKAPDRDNVPTIFTMVGVALTFVGVFIGLRNFDVVNIDASITDLLEGLKLAFSSSILGLLFAIAFRGTTLYLKRADDSIETFEEFADQIRESLQDIRKTNKETAEHQNSTSAKMDALVNSICGDGETTLYTQFQKMRTSVFDLTTELSNKIEQNGNRLTDAIKDLRTSSEKDSQRLYDAYIEYAQKMAEYNAKALAEQFEQLIKDFNSKIHEQFGENFKRLNEAVGRMLEWQDNYQQQLENMNEQFQQATKAIDEAAYTLTVVSEQSETFKSSAQNLELLLGNLSEQTTLIGEQIEALNDTGERAKEALPLISASVSRLTDEFTRSTEDAVSTMKQGWQQNQQSAIDQWEQHRNSLTEQNQQIKEAVEASSRQMSEALNGSLTQMNDTVSNTSTMLQQTSKSSKDTMKSALTSLTKAYDDTAAVVKQQTTEQLSSISNSHTQAQQQIEQFMRDATARYENTLRTQMEDLQQRLVTQTRELDTALGEELTKSLESLGSNLASLSQRFVSDYSPLTDKLKDLVRIAESAERRQ